MRPFNSQTGSNPTNSSLNSLYTSLFGLGPNLNQVFPPMYPQSYIDAVYSTLFLQNSQMLLQSALLTQAQKDAGLSNQLWQSMVAPTVPTKSSSKKLADVGGGINCDSHSKARIDPCVNANTSLDITKTFLNQNLEMSEMKKSKPSAFVEPQRVMENNIHDTQTLFEKESEEGAKKRLKLSDKEPKNQLELGPNYDKIIKPLQANDCAFDSNEESDSEHIGPHKLGNICVREPAHHRKEELKEKSLILKEQSVSSTRYNDEKWEMKTERSKNDLEDNQLERNELDELNSSFSSDDSPNSNEYADFQLLK